MCKDVFDAYGIAYDAGQWDRWAGSEVGKCLVVGTGWNMWEDLENAGFIAGEWIQPFHVMAVNRAVQDLPCFVTHAYSNHAKNLKIWAAGRDEVHLKKDQRIPDKTVLHSLRDGHGGVTWRWPGWGTSSLCAVLTAITLGYKEIVVCGVPMDNGPHYYDPPWHKTNFANDHNDRHWISCAKRVFKGKVKVLSGRLKDLV